MAAFANLSLPDTSRSQRDLHHSLDSPFADPDICSCLFWHTFTLPSFRVHSKSVKLLLDQPSVAALEVDFTIDGQ